MALFSSGTTVRYDPDTHTYTYNGKVLNNVTTWIQQYSKPFEALYPSIQKAKFNTKHNKGIQNAKLLRKYWRLNGQRARLLGSAAHTFVEMYLLDRTSIPTTNYDIAAIRAIQAIELKWDIVKIEYKVFDIDSNLAGTVDIKLQHKVTKEYAILDWKTSKDMHKKYNNLLPPFKKYHASSLYKNKLQLFTYSYLDTDTIPLNNHFIVQLTGSGVYNVFRTSEQDAELRELLDEQINNRKQLDMDFLNSI